VADTSTDRRTNDQKTRPPSRRSLVEPGRLDGWEKQSLCAQTDDTLFFHPEGERGATRRARAEAAKAICRTCPVMMECRAKSLRTREQYGTWGGLSEDERARVLAGKPLKVRTPKAPPKPKLAPLVMAGPEIPRHSLKRNVPAGPTVDHLRRLGDAGYTISDVARAAGLHHTGLGEIASGSRESVTERTAALILSVCTEDEAAARSVAA
jgi:WhiB family redox-sensing transcriptional regulator